MSQRDSRASLRRGGSLSRKGLVTEVTIALTGGEGSLAAGPSGGSGTGTSPGSGWALFTSFGSFVMQAQTWPGVSGLSSESLPLSQQVGPGPPSEPSATQQHSGLAIKNARSRVRNGRTMLTTGWDLRGLDLFLIPRTRDGKLVDELAPSGNCSIRTSSRT